MAPYLRGINGCLEGCLKDLKALDVVFDGGCPIMKQAVGELVFLSRQYALPDGWGVVNRLPHELACHGVVFQKQGQRRQVEPCHGPRSVRGYSPYVVQRERAWLGGLWLGRGRRQWRLRRRAV